MRRCETDVKRKWKEIRPEKPLGSVRAAQFSSGFCLGGNLGLISRSSGAATLRCASLAVCVPDIMARASQSSLLKVQGGCAINPIDWSMFLPRVSRLHASCPVLHFVAKYDRKSFYFERDVKRTTVKVVILSTGGFICVWFSFPWFPNNGTSSLLIKNIFHWNFDESEFVTSLIPKDSPLFGEEDSNCCHFTKPHDDLQYFNSFHFSWKINIRIKKSIFLPQIAQPCRAERKETSVLCDLM